MPQPGLWRMLLSGNRVRIAEAATQIESAGKTDEYAALLLEARRWRAPRDRRIYSVLSLVWSHYTERERRSALTALGVLWGPLGRELGTALDHKASHFDREGAYKAIIERRDQRAVGPLISALLSGAAPEHWLCITALGRLGDIRAADALVRYMALDVLPGDPLLETRSPQHWHAQAQFGNEVGRALRMLNAKGALEKAKTALDSISSYQQAAAARILGGWGDEDMAESLVALLEAPVPTVREAAAAALGDLKAISALEVLQSYLSDPDLEVRAAVEHAVQRIVLEQTQRRLRKRQEAYHGLPRRADGNEAISKAVSR